MADNVIETLRIKIEAETNEATKGFDKLQKTISRFTYNLSGMKAMTSRLQALGGTLSNIGRTKGVRYIQELNKPIKINLNTDAIDKLKDKAISSTESYKQLKSTIKQISKIAENYGTDFIKSDGEFKAVIKDARKLQSVVSKIGIKKAVSDISILKDEFNKTYNSIQAIGKKYEPGNNFLDSLGRIKDRLKEIYEQSEKNRKILNASKSVGDYASYKSSGSIPRQIRSKSGMDASRLRESISDIDRSLNNSGIKDKVAQLNLLSSAFKKLSSYAKNSGNIISRVFSVSLKKTTDITKKLGSSLKNNVINKIPKFSNGLRKLASSFERVIRYRIVAGIINQITDGLKEGIDNLYQYSKSVGTSFSINMDSAATPLQYFRNSLASAAEPILNAVIPYFDMFIDKIVEGLNWLNQFISQLTGASTWTKAIRQQKEYAEAVNDTTDAIKRSVAGFDELNIVGNQGGSDTITDYAGMFEEVSLDTITLEFPDWANRFIDSIKNQNWESAGAALAEKVNSIFDSINFESIGEELGNKINAVIEFVSSLFKNVNFENIGSSLANIFNGLFDSVNFENLGNVFAQKWNALIDTLYGFITNADWAKFGRSISEFINGWASEFNFEQLIQTLQGLISAIFTSLNEAIVNTKWYELGSKIGNAFNEIDWASLIGQLVKTIDNSLKSAYQFVFGLIDGLNWAQLGKQLWDTICNVVKNINWSELISNAFKPLGKALGASGSLISSFVMQAFNSISNAYRQLKGYFASKIEEVGGDVILGIYNGIIGALASVGTWIKDHIFQPLIDGICSVFQINSPSKVMAEYGGYIAEGLKQGIADKWESIVNWFSERLISLKNTIISVISGIKDALRVPINSILGFIESMVNGVIDGLNLMIRAMNKLSFDVPDWVPAIGGKTFGFNISEINKINIPKLASGGYPSVGQVFIAREAGPEMVGTIGGRNAVANNGQIIAGIQYGVASAMNSVLMSSGNNGDSEAQNSLLREQNALLKKIAEKELVVSPSVSLGRVVKKSQKLAETVTGG
ncbi:MAG: hypothetical protein ACI3ZQ_05745 [Candidatus Cryptobacteroides sp.]